MPLSHYSLPVGAHYNAMKAFYTAILQPLGYAPAIEGEQYCGFAPPNGPPDFWLGGGRVDNGLPLYDGDLAQRIAPVHVAFQADSQEAVDAWYEHAM